MRARSRFELPAGGARVVGRVATAVRRTVLIVVAAALATCVTSVSFARSNPGSIIYSALLDEGANLAGGYLRLEQDRKGSYRQSTAIGNDNPFGVAVDSSGNVYVANSGTNTVTVYAPSDGGFNLKTQIGGPDTGLWAPAAVAIDGKGQIYILNGVFQNAVRGVVTQGSSVVVFRAGSSGDAVPVATIKGNATGQTWPPFSPNGIAVDAAGNIYVSNWSGNSDQGGNVLVYGPHANGNVGPRAVLEVGGLASPTAIAVDKKGNLYVASKDISNGPPFPPPVISVYPPGANGNATPIGSISSSAGFNGTGWISGLSVDAAGRIYVAGGFGTPTGDSVMGVEVFAPGSNGDVAPVATISGPSTKLTGPSGIAVDQAGQVYVAQESANNVTVYPPGSNGDAAPAATITRGQTPFGGAISVDSAGNVYACGDGSGNQRISVFAPGTTDGPPIRTIGQLSTSGSVACAVDPQGHIYVLREQNSTGAKMIVEYAAGSGDVPPVATIAGSNTGLDNESNTPGLAVDMHGNVYVAKRAHDSQGATVASSSILVFPAGSDGNVTPAATIAGSHAGLSSRQKPGTHNPGILGIALDAKGYIYAPVVDQSAALNDTPHLGNVIVGRLLVFAPGSQGDAKPARVVRLKGTGVLSGGIALDHSGNLYVPLQFFYTLGPGDYLPLNEVGLLAPNAKGDVVEGLVVDPSFPDNGFAVFPRTTP